MESQTRLWCIWKCSLSRCRSLMSKRKGQFCPGSGVLSWCIVINITDCPCFLTPSIDDHMWPDKDWNCQFQYHISGRFWAICKFHWNRKSHRNLYNGTGPSVLVQAKWRCWICWSFDDKAKVQRTGWSFEIWDFSLSCCIRSNVSCDTEWWMQTSNIKSSRRS